MDLVSDETNFQAIEVATTTVLTGLVFYLLVMVSFRITFYLKHDQKSLLEAKATPRNGQNTSVIQTHRTGENNHPFLMLHVYNALLLSSVLFRCIFYIVLVAMRATASQLACDLLFEVVDLLRGMGLMALYTFIWRLQRNFYYHPILNDFYSMFIRVWSWSVAVCAALVAMIRIMLQITRWRYGVQFDTSNLYGCVSEVYNSTERNLTITEWNFPFIYNSFCGIALLLLIGFLYVYLHIKMCTHQVFAHANSKRSMDEIIEVRHWLLRATLCSLISLSVSVLPQILLWLVFPFQMPAVLFNQMDDVAALLQGFAMVFSLDDWKDTFTPKALLYCSKKDAELLQKDESGSSSCQDVRL